MIGVLGGTLGAILGSVAAIALPALQGLPVALTWWLVMLAPVGGLLVGLLSAVRPAVTAMRVEPIEALRG